VVVTVSAIAEVRLPCFHLRGEFQRDHYFADADRMKPGALLARKRGASCSIVEAEPLTEFVPVIPASQHFDHVTRQKDEQRQRKKQVVDEADHFSDQGTKRLASAPVVAGAVTPVERRLWARSCRRRPR
jgi:hypothetical protein